MDRKHLIQQLQAYIPFNEQEKKDKRIFLEQLNIENIFQRENEVGHFTASCWIVNQDHTKVLLAYHNFFQSYAWLGGHCDGDEDLFQADDQEESHIKEDENSAIAWFDRSSFMNQVNEVWMKERIYQKLNSQIIQFFDEK